MYEQVKVAKKGAECLDVGIRIDILKYTFIDFGNGHKANINLLWIKVLNVLRCVPFAR